MLGERDGHSQQWLTASRPKVTAKQGRTECLRHCRRLSDPLIQEQNGKDRRSHAMLFKVWQEVLYIFVILLLHVVNEARVRSTVETKNLSRLDKWVSD